MGGADWLNPRRKGFPRQDGRRVDGDSSRQNPFLLLMGNINAASPLGKHLQNLDDFKSGGEAEEEAIRRRAGMESKLYWQVGERAEE